MNDILATDLLKNSYKCKNIGENPKKFWFLSANFDNFCCLKKCIFVFLSKLKI